MFRFSVEELRGTLQDTKGTTSQSPPVNTSSIIFILILFIIIILAIYLYKKFFKKT